MDINTLKTYISLVQIGNFTRTSEKLLIAQSTVTNRIADLEKEVGKTLLIRGSKQVEMTSEGKIFYDYAKRIVDLEIKAKESINRDNFFEKNICIGTTNTIYEAYLEKEIINLRKDNNKTSLKVILGHSQELLLMLQDKIIDKAYTYVPLYKSGVNCEIFQKDKLLLVTSYDNKKFMSGIDKRQLAQVDYYMCNFKLKGIGEFLSQLFPPFKEFSFEIDNSVKMLPYILNGNGYSFLPEKIVEDFINLKKLRIIPLKDFNAPEIISYTVTRSI